MEYVINYNILHYIFFVVLIIVLLVFRDIIRNAVNAADSDAVIFTGSGCTAAVHKLIHALHLDQPPVCNTIK